MACSACNRKRAAKRPVKSSTKVTVILKKSGNRKKR